MEKDNQRARLEKLIPVLQMTVTYKKQANSVINKPTKN